MKSRNEASLHFSNIAMISFFNSSAILDPSFHNFMVQVNNILYYYMKQWLLTHTFNQFHTIGYAFSTKTEGELQNDTKGDIRK